MPALHRLALTAALVCLAAPAHAERGIVLESHAGARPGNADQVLEPILGVLVTRDFDVGDAVVGRTFESRVSRAAITTGMPADFAQQVDRGHRSFVAGNFEEAVGILTPLIDTAHANPGAFAADKTLRGPLSKALVDVALSHGRMGDTSAQDQTFGELLRSFPETLLSRGTHGPDAVTAFEKAKKALTSTKQGKLTVTAADERSAIYINENLDSVGTASRNVLPGTYRVFVQAGKQLSRSHTVRVEAGDDVSIQIDAEFDAAVHTSPGWTGLAFATAADREKLEATYAADFATSLRAQGAGVVILGIDTSKGRSVVYGALVNPRTGREIRRASVALDPAPADDRLRALATFLVDNRPTEGVEIMVAGQGTTAEGPTPGPGPAPDQPTRDGGRWGGWKYLTAVGALGAFGAGAYLLANDNECADDLCLERNAYLPGGIAALAGGAVLAGLTVYLFVSGDGPDEAPASSAFILPTRDGVMAGLTGSF